MFSPPGFPTECFTRQGELTKNGFVRINNYLNHVAVKARELGVKLGMPFRHDIMSS